jgi:iron complex transport system ATP-binding protein
MTIGAVTNADAPAGIRARAVSVRLGGRTIVEAVDVDAAPGCLTAIVGPNGSGKTTLLRALAGLVDFSGHIEVAGADIQRLRPAERARTIAYLPQASELRAMLSVRQVVALGRYATHPGLFASTHADDVAVRSALARVRIPDLLEQTYPRLSGGQKRLVLLARALATGATTLLLDEPTASLDIKHALELFELLTELAGEGYAVVVVLHDLDDVQRHARSALLLDAGRARAVGSPGEPAFVSAAERTYGVSLVPHDRLGFRLPARPTAAADAEASP